MKKVLIFLPFLFLLGPLFGQATEIAFDHREWKEILAQAKQENKLVFMDAYTTWCGPCKTMAATVFTDSAVADFYNSNFINAKIDMEKGEGPGLGKKYGVSAYPTLIFVNGDGKLVHTQVGIFEADAFIDLGKMVLEPDFISLVMMAKRFEDGERDRTFLKDYLVRLDARSEDFPKVLEPFLPGMLGEGLLEENSWEVFETCIVDETSEVAQYFLTHREDFERKYGAEDVQSKAGHLYMHMSRIAAAKNDMKAFAEAQRTVRASGLPDARAEACWMAIDMYARKKDIHNYVKACNKLYKSTPGEDFLNQKSFQGRDVASVAEKKSDLRLPLRWLRDVAKQRQDYQTLKTLALIELKMGKTKKGMANAEKAIAAAKVEELEYTATTEMIEKYRPNAK